MLEKGLSKQTLLQPAKFNRFVSGLARQVKVDDGLSVAELRKTALSVRVRPENIDLLQAPIKGTGTSPDGQSIVVVDASQMTELAEALKADQLEAYIAEHPEG